MIGKFIKELKNQGKRQIDIEKETGLRQSYVSRLERGAKPSIDTVILLADTYEVSTDKVLGRDEKTCC